MLLQGVQLARVPTRVAASPESALSRVAVSMFSQVKERCRPPKERASKGGIFLLTPAFSSLCLASQCRALCVRSPSWCSSRALRVVLLVDVSRRGRQEDGTMARGFGCFIRRCVLL
eukprot:scaffold12986_cov31-Tisochrysis_lutea.AAC.2